MSQYCLTFVSAALETATEFGVPANRLGDFEKILIEKMKTQPGSRFVYTADFLLQFQKRCTECPSGLDPNAPYSLPCISKGKGQKNRYKKTGELSPKTEPVQLRKSDNAWKPPSFLKTEQDPKTVALRKIGGILNKLTEETYNKLSEDIIEELHPEYVADFIPKIFDKAVWDNTYRHMYANLCNQLMKKFGADIFGKPLLAQCQAEFTKPMPSKPDTDDPLEFEEYDYALETWKKRRLGGIYFIVELLKVRIVFPKIIINCLCCLLKHDPTKPITDDIQHAAELLAICRGQLGKSERQMTDPSIRRLHAFLVAGKLATRDQFKVEDTLALFKKTPVKTK